MRGTETGGYFEWYNFQGHAKLKDSGEYKEEHKDGRNHGVEVTQLFLARFIFLKGTRDVPIKWFPFLDVRK